MAARSRKRRRKGPAEDRDFLHYLKIMIAIMIVALIVLSCYSGYHFGRLVFSNDSMTDLGNEAREYVLTVSEGESVLQVGLDLEENGIIQSALAFTAQAKVYQCKIAPGTYTVSSEKSSKLIIKYLNTEYEKAKQEDSE